MQTFNEVLKQNYLCFMVLQEINLDDKKPTQKVVSTINKYIDTVNPMIINGQLINNIRE